MGLGLDSLMNTLVGMDPRTLAQAAEEEERQRLGANTAQAAAAAQQAAGAYQGAAEAPVPELGMLEQFIPALLGNVASVIAQDPSYRQRGQEQIKESRAALLQSRAQNLQALRDIWGQKAEAAQKAGDLEAEATARQKREQISKIYEVVSQNAEYASRLKLQEAGQAASLEQIRERQRGEMAQIHEGARQQRLTQAAKPEPPAVKTARIRAGVDENDRLLPTFARSQLTKYASIAKGSRSGADRNTAINGMLSIVRERWSTDDRPSKMLNRILAERHPRYGANQKEARYLLTEKKVYRRKGKGWEVDPDNRTEAEALADLEVARWFGGP